MSVESYETVNIFSSAVSRECLRDQRQQSSVS